MDVIVGQPAPSRTGNVKGKFPAVKGKENPPEPALDPSGVAHGNDPASGKHPDMGDASRDILPVKTAVDRKRRGECKRRRINRPTKAT
jgi:hypothetical protein